MRIELIAPELKALRQIGIAICFADYLTRKFPQFCANDSEYQVENYYSEYGIDLEADTLQAMFNISDENVRNWLIKETINSALHKAIQLDTTYRNLIAFTARPQTGRVTQPYIDLTNMRPIIKKGKEVPKGGKFEEDTITLSDKSTNFKKFGRTLNIPYEVIADCTLKTLSEYLMGYAAVVNWDKKEYIIDILMNGDGAVDKENTVIEDPAVVIGVQDTNAGLTFKDILLPSIRMNRLGRPVSAMVAGETETIDTMMLPEYKDRQQGTPYSKLQLKGDVSTPDSAYIADSVGTSKTLLVSPKFAVAEYIRQSVMIEDDRNITRQLIEVVVSERISYMIVFSDSRIVIDHTKAYSGNPLPPSFDVRKY
jgi:hypothetical protein